MRYKGLSRGLIVIAGTAALATGVAAASQTAAPRGTRPVEVHHPRARISRDNGPRLHGAAARAWRGFSPTGGSLRSRQGDLTRLNSHFAVFRSAARTARVAGASSSVPSPPSDPQGFGLVVSERRYVAVTPSFGVWVTPGTGGACLDWTNQDVSTPPASAGGCNPNPTAVEAGGLFSLIPAGETGGSALFVGLVPDGTRDVSVTLPDGSVTTATPHDNVFSVNEPGSVKSSDLPFKRFTVTSSTGQQTTW